MFALCAVFVAARPFLAGSARCFALRARVGDSPRTRRQKRITQVSDAWMPQRPSSSLIVRNEAPLSRNAAMSQRTASNREARDLALFANADAAARNRASASGGIVSSVMRVKRYGKRERSVRCRMSRSDASLGANLAGSRQVSARHLASEDAADAAAGS